MWCVLVTANSFDTRYCSSVNKEVVSFQGHDILQIYTHCEKAKHTVSSERCHTVSYYRRHYNFHEEIIPYNDSVNNTGSRVVC